MTRSGYYAWRGRAESAHTVQDRNLLDQIRRLFARHGGRYGSPRIHHELAVRGYRGKAGVHRFYTAQPNLLRRGAASRVDHVWVGDITYLAVAGGWRYLAVVMDQCSRRILAWTLQSRRDSQVTRAVLDAALRRRHPKAGLIFHSDRGSEYLAQPFRVYLQAHGIRQSASTAGPGDNAHMESFFHSLKAEVIRGCHFATEHEVRAVLRSYIRYYNETRAHSALGYRSPIAFERQAA